MDEVRVCPKCRSSDVELTSALLSVFAGIDNYRCKRCGFSSRIFPVKVNPVKVNGKNRGRK